MRNLIFFSTLFTYLVCSVIIVNKAFAQIKFEIPQDKTSNSPVFDDPNNKTTTTTQAIYEQGGQSETYRLTESEKALDFLKKELFALKNEVDTLKREVEALKAPKIDIGKRKDGENMIVPALPVQTQPSKVPTPY